MLNSDARIWQVREWIATFLATGTWIYELVVEHSAHREVYAFALVLYGFVPWSMAGRLLARWAERLTDDDDRQGGGGPRLGR